MKTCINVDLIKFYKLVLCFIYRIYCSNVIYDFCIVFLKDYERMEIKKEKIEIGCTHSQQKQQMHC